MHWINKRGVPIKLPGAKLKPQTAISYSTARSQFPESRKGDFNEWNFFSTYTGHTLYSKISLYTLPQAYCTISGNPNNPNKSISSSLL